MGELYYAAWALVLARHSDDGDAGLVSFDCTAGTLHLTYSLETPIGAFIDEVSEKVRQLLGNGPTPDEGPGQLRPFASTLRVGTAEPTIQDSRSHRAKVLRIDSGSHFTGDALEITCPRDGEGTAIQALHGGRMATSTSAEILVAHLETAVVQLQSLPPSTPLRQIQLFGRFDEHHLLRWNREPPPSVEESLVGLFARQVRLQPEAPAVCACDDDLSYAELDDVSLRLAGELVRRGVKDGDAVALCFDKSALAVVAMLAVLRAGANFVHLGVSTPKLRRDQILAACDATLLLVDSSNDACLNDHVPLTGLRIDLPFVVSLEVPTAPLPIVSSHHVAATTFTSGSTGLPKGIVVEHGSIATSCEAMATRFDIGPHTRILQFASYTFDASVGDVFYGLSRGACVCCPSEDERVDTLAAAARRMQVNWAFITPSVLSLLQPSDIPSLRRLLLGGEPPAPNHVWLWAKSVSLHLVMGPAECAIYCAGSDAVVPGQDTSTFGRAAGCRMWVVDPEDHTKLAPIGCPGELVVEGRIVARGYLNDDSRTGSSFFTEAPWLPSQLQTNSSTRRLYKSGDLVRFDVDNGTFSFLARKDTQVKLHGQRVELGEIEHHLRELVPGLKSTAVVLNTSAGETSRHPLVAFLVFDKSTPDLSRTTDCEKTAMITLAPRGIEILRAARERMASVLPSYMMPTLFIPLQIIPYTLNGKRDVVTMRKLVDGLSQHQIHAFSLSEDVDMDAQPLSSQEEQLRDLWVEVLNVDPLRITSRSDFIHEGGDSLAAMRLGTAATKSEIQLSVATILGRPRLSDMAAEMTVAEAQEDSPEPYSLLPELLDIEDFKTRCAAACGVSVDQVQDIYPSTPPQGMLWGAALVNPGTYVLRMIFRLPPNTQLDVFIAAWNRVVESADIFRTRLVADVDVGLVQVVLKGFEWDAYKSVQEFEDQKHHLSMVHGSQLARLAVIQEDGSSDTPIFAFTAHHVLYDGFMLNMLFDRVAEIYQTGRSHPFSPFTNYVAHLQRVSSAPALEYWKSTLEGSHSPTWPPPRAPDHLATAHIRQHIPVPQRPKEFTLAVIAQAAFTLVAADQTGTDDVGFCMTFSGREAPVRDILNIPGPTIFTIPFRTLLSRHLSLHTLYTTIRRTITSASTHGYIGLPTIRTASPSAARATNFRALFAVQPRRVEPPSSVFGEQLSFKEDMGRLPLIFEAWLVEGGLDLVVEFNTSCLGRGEMEGFVGRFVGVLEQMLEMPYEALVGDVKVGGEGKVNEAAQEGSDMVRGVLNGDAGKTNGEVEEQVAGVPVDLNGDVGKVNGEVEKEVADVPVELNEDAGKITGGAEEEVADVPVDSNGDAGKAKEGGEEGFVDLPIDPSRIAGKANDELAEQDAKESC